MLDDLNLRGIVHVVRVREKGAGVEIPRAWHAISVNAFLYLRAHDLGAHPFEVV